MIQRTAILILFCLVNSVTVFAQCCIEDFLMQQGIDRTNIVDLTPVSKFSLKEPQLAIVNITGVAQMPQTKYKKQDVDMHAWLEVYDGNGNYFKKKVLLNGQGDSSMKLAKKNFAIDFCEDEWIGNATTDITIGDWVSQDAFHFKAFYNDYFRGLGEVAYKVYDQITEEVPIMWARAGIIDGGQALCHPEGFPCVVFLNGEYYGLFAWQLKKNRKNMAMEKSVAEHVYLDGDLRDELIFRGEIDWTRFEIKNPKTLYCVEIEEISGWEYKKITDEEEITSIADGCSVAGEKPSDWTNEKIVALYGQTPPTYLFYEKKGNYYKLNVLSGLAYKKYDGDHPKELIDETMPYFDNNNKDHVNTASVKKYIVSMARYWNELNTIEETGADEVSMRREIAKRYDIDALLDYYIHFDLLANNDGTRKNWQWFTYDGVRWFVSPYDLDQTFGLTLEGGRPMPADLWTSNITSGPFYWISKYFKKDKEQRYAKLRHDGHIDAERIKNLVRDWHSRIGEDLFSFEKEKWPESPCFNEVICPKGWQPSEQWKLYGKKQYAMEAVYSLGDVVTLDGGVWEATETISGVTPYIRNSHIDSLDRVLDWVDTRISFLDKKYGYDVSKYEPEDLLPQVIEYILNDDAQYQLKLDVNYDGFVNVGDIIKIMPNANWLP